MSGYVETPTEVIEGRDGTRFSFRRLGDDSGARPLLLLQHFRGNLDNWDPDLIDRLAETRRVITFDNVGVGATTGLTPSSIGEMARGVLAFTDALELDRVDLLGFSIGGFIAQEVVLIRPDLVENLILAATAPKGGPGLHGWVPDILDAVSHHQTSGPDLLHAFFKDTPTSQAAGKEFLGRFSQRQQDRDPASSWQTRNAHYDAVVEWGIPHIASLERLSAIGQPTFVANGDDDRMIPPRYSLVLAGLIPKATVKIYPDSAHGFLFQHRIEFVADVNAFLGAP